MTAFILTSLLVAQSLGLVGAYGAAGAAEGLREWLETVARLRQTEVEPAPPVPQSTFDGVILSSRHVYIVGSDGQFLGCWDCVTYDSNSVHSAFGRYGSSLSRVSIHNPLSPYGSSLSNYSACNQLAARPPLFVTPTRTLGELTINEARPRRIVDEEVLVWLTAVCAGR
jgi:hypothetical protein